MDRVASQLGIQSTVCVWEHASCLSDWLHPPIGSGSICFCQTSRDSAWSSARASLTRRGVSMDRCMREYAGSTPGLPRLLSS